MKDLRVHDSDFVPERILTLMGADQPQYIYMAVAEATVAQLLRLRVFRPYYVLDCTETRELLQLLEQKNPRKGSLLRCLLATAFHVYKRDASDLAREAADEVATYLFARVDNRSKAFRDELVKLFHRGYDIWQVVQRSEIPPSVSDFKEDPGTWEESTDKCNDYDDLVTLKEEQEVYRPPLVDPYILLFPRISVGQDIIHRGTALWSDQNVVVAAHISYQGYGKQRSESLLRQGSRRRRTASRTSARPMSFTEHAQARNGNASVSPK